MPGTAVVRRNSVCYLNLSLAYSTARCVHDATAGNVPRYAWHRAPRLTVGIVGLPWLHLSPLVDRQRGCHTKVDVVDNVAWLSPQGAMDWHLRRALTERRVDTCCSLIAATTIDWGLMCVGLGWDQGGPWLFAVACGWGNWRSIGRVSFRNDMFEFPSDVTTVQTLLNGLVETWKPTHPHRYAGVRAGRNRLCRDRERVLQAPCTISQCLLNPFHAQYDVL